MEYLRSGFRACLRRSTPPSSLRCCWLSRATSGAGPTFPIVEQAVFGFDQRIGSREPDREGDRMPDTELHYLELTELTRRIHARESSAVQAAQAQLDRIGSLDGKLRS